MKSRYIKSKRWKYLYYGNSNQKKGGGVLLTISEKADFRTRKFLVASYLPYWWERCSHPGVEEMAEHTTHNTGQLKPQWFTNHMYSQPGGVDLAYHTRTHGACIREQSEQPGAVETGFTVSRGRRVCPWSLQKDVFRTVWVIPLMNRGLKPVI